jgi:monovalent cation/proton antiporter MnhG/PhaG subunit
VSPHHAVALVLLVLGCAALLLSAAGLLAMPDTFGKLHALTPASTVGCPAIALAVAIDEGIGRATVKFLFIAAVTAAGGAVAAMAIGRVLVSDVAEARDVAQAAGVPEVALATETADRSDQAGSTP